MSEWQPAILDPHDCNGANSWRGREAAIRGALIRVRPIHKTAIICSCGHPWFRVHPEDAERLGFAPIWDICERDFLTD